MADNPRLRPGQTPPLRRQRSTTPLWIGLGFAVLCLLGVMVILALPGNMALHSVFFGPDASPTAEGTPWPPGEPTETVSEATLPPAAPTPFPTVPPYTPPPYTPPPTPVSPPTPLPLPTSTEPPDHGVIKIGVDLPTSGADATVGIPTRNGVELAIEQANAAGGILLGDKPYRIEMFALDDAINGVHNPEQGIKNVPAFVADADVLAVVGPYNSNVARAIMPILNQAGLTLISPANTNETLTKPKYGQTAIYRPTGKLTYFRVTATDDLQGIVAADYLYDRLNVKNLFILDDTETYGKPLADTVEQRFRGRGGTVAGHEGVPKGTQGFRTILTKLAGITPKLDALFYGGTTSNGLALARKQMGSVGFDARFMGGDGILEDEFLKVAGDASEGSLATRAWENTVALPEAAPFLAAYRAHFGVEAGEYSAQAYDATNIILDAIRRAGRRDREAVRAAVAATDYQGVLGRTRFDANGDTTNRWISVFTVKDGQWVFTDQMQATGTAPPADSTPLPTNTATPVPALTPTVTQSAASSTSTATLPAPPPTPIATPPELPITNTATVAPALPSPSIAPPGPHRVQKIGLVGDVGMITDQGFNQASWEGVQQAANVLGAKAHYIETHDPKDYVMNIEQLVAEGYDPIVTVGAPMGEATVAAALLHPEIIFIGVDQFSTAPAWGERPRLSNYANLIFHEDQAGFLAGALAGLMSKSQNVGAVLGSDYVPAIWRYGEGFRAGAQHVQSNIKIQIAYRDDVDLYKTSADPAWGKVTAISMIDKGADVIFGAGGATGTGALMGAAEHRNIYALGVETDQYYTVPEARAALLSSAVKRITPELSRILQQVRDGTFTPSNNYGEIGLAPFHDLDAQVPETVRTKIAVIEQGLNDGSIITGVPEMKP